MPSLTAPQRGFPGEFERRALVPVLSQSQMDMNQFFFNFFGEILLVLPLSTQLPTCLEYNPCALCNVSLAICMDH